MPKSAKYMQWCKCNIQSSSIIQVVELCIVSFNIVWPYHQYVLIFISHCQGLLVKSVCSFHYQTTAQPKAFTIQLFNRPLLSSLGHARPLLLTFISAETQHIWEEFLFLGVRHILPIDRNKEINQKHNWHTYRTSLQGCTINHKFMKKGNIQY